VLYFFFIYSPTPSLGPLHPRKDVGGRRSLGLADAVGAVRLMPFLLAQAQKVSFYVGKAQNRWFGVCYAGTRSEFAAMRHPGSCNSGRGPAAKTAGTIMTECPLAYPRLITTVAAKKKKLSFCVFQACGPQ
jgi:hypothetical protein